MVFSSSSFSDSSLSLRVKYPDMYISAIFVSGEIKIQDLILFSNISADDSSNRKPHFGEQWAVSRLKSATKLSKESKSLALEIFNFSMTCCTVIKYVPREPWLKLLNSFSNGSVENSLRMTY